MSLTYTLVSTCVFAEQLGAQKRKHAITLRLHGELNRGMTLFFKMSRKLSAHALFGIMVSVSSLVMRGHLAFTLQGFFNAVHKSVG